MNEINKVIILGRGASLERLKEFKNEDNIDTIILVNTFWESFLIPVAYYKDEIIHNFIKDKKIILIMNPYMLQKKHGYDLSKLNLFREKYNVIESYKTNCSKKFRVSDNETVCKNLPNELIEYFINMRNNYRNCDTLGLAILFADKILKCKQIITFGLDFYEKDYYLQNNHEYKYQLKRSDENKKVWYNFLEKYSHINLSIYSLADISLFNTLTNVSVK